MKKAAEEAKLLAMSKPEIIKVVHEEALKAGNDPKILESAKWGSGCQKIHDAEMKVLNREHSPKVKKVMKLRKKRLDQYMWTTTSRIKPEPITDVKIHPNTKPAVIIVYKGTNRRNFFGAVHNPFRKRKIMEFEPAIHIPALECNESLPKNVLFVNNMVIEEPEYGMFFIDVFGDEAFQRMNDIHKVDIETLLTYLVMASNINTPEDTRFCLKLRKLIKSHLDQEKLKSKKVKLESVGYKLD
ncbi:hypothetical protein Tco_1384908 [Tanacetum coccineum]